MFMDGDIVNVGDQVFDLQRGVGTVTEILPQNMARAQFGPRAVQVTFSQTGVRRGSENRMVFWANPVLAAPFKDSQTWYRIASAVDAIIQTLRERLP